MQGHRGRRVGAGRQACPGAFLVCTAALW